MSAIPTESVACDGSELELPVAVFHPFVFADIFSPPTLDALISSLSSVEQTQFMSFLPCPSQTDLKVLGFSSLSIYHADCLLRLLSGRLECFVEPLQLFRTRLHSGQFHPRYQLQARQLQTSQWQHHAYRLHVHHTLQKNYTRLINFSRRLKKSYDEVGNLFPMVNAPQAPSFVAPSVPFVRAIPIKRKSMQPPVQIPPNTLPMLPISIVTGSTLSDNSNTSTVITAPIIPPPVLTSTQSANAELTRIYQHQQLQHQHNLHLHLLQQQHAQQQKMKLMQQMSMMQSANSSGVAAISSQQSVTASNPTSTNIIQNPSLQAAHHTLSQLSPELFQQWLMMQHLQRAQSMMTNNQINTGYNTSQPALRVPTPEQSALPP